MFIYCSFSLHFSTCSSTKIECKYTIEGDVSFLLVIASYPADWKNNNVLQSQAIIMSNLLQPALATIKELYMSMETSSMTHTMEMEHA